MGEIFMTCLCYTNTYFVDGSRRNSPQVLSNVSQLWRNVALKNPELWASIDIVYFARAGVLWPQIPLIKLWLSRSGSLPLSFSLDFVDWESVEILEEVFHLYMPEIGRWQNVKLAFWPTLDSTLLGTPVRLGEAPFLKTLAVRVRHAETYPLPLLSLISNSRHLQSLTLDARMFNTPTMVSTPWETLSILHLKCQLPIRECLIVLETCKALESCSFEDVSADESLIEQSFPYTKAPLEHKSLHSLRIESKLNISLLIRRLTLPSLTTLILIGEDARTERWIPTVLSSFVLRSKPPLRKLILDNVPVDEPEIIDCLYALPSLRALHLNDDGIPVIHLTSDIILKLGGYNTAYPTAPLICPKLEVIKLQGRVLSSDGDLANMIQTRRQAAARDTATVAMLRAIHFEFYAGPHDMDMSCMKKWRKEGMVAHVFVK